MTELTGEKKRFFKKMFDERKVCANCVWYIVKSDKTGFRHGCGYLWGYQPIYGHSDRRTCAKWTDDARYKEFCEKYDFPEDVDYAISEHITGICAEVIAYTLNVAVQTVQGWISEAEKAGVIE